MTSVQARAPCSCRQLAPALQQDLRQAATSARLQVGGKKVKGKAGKNVCKWVGSKKEGSCDPASV